MSVEKMIEEGLQTANDAVDYAKRQAQRKATAIQKRLSELQELHDKLLAATDEDDILSLEEEAADLAEELGIYFIYVRNGKERRYSPEAFWEPSGGCEWVESAQYGEDYGWDIY